MKCNEIIEIRPASNAKAIVQFETFQCEDTDRMKILYTGIASF